MNVDSPAGPVRPRVADDVRRALGWYRHGLGDPTTWLGSTSMVRAMLTPDGPAAARLDWGGEHGELRADAWGPGAAWAEASVRSMVAAPSDYELPTNAPRSLREVARRNPYLTAGASGDLYHALLPTIIAQRITAAEAVRHWSALVGRLGEPAPGPFPGLLLPPSPERLALCPSWWFHPLGIERKRAAAIVAVARVAHHLWDWARLPTTAETAAKLSLVSGLGPWTIGSVLGPVCGDDDAVAVGDYHLPNVVAWNLAGEPRADDARMLELLGPYQPQRGRVLRLLGTAGRRPPAFGPRHRILPIHRY